MINTIHCIFLYTLLNPEYLAFITVSPTIRTHMYRGINQAQH